MSNSANQWVLAMDIGGTSIQSALVNRRGELVPDTPVFTRINADGSAVEILRDFTDVIECRIHTAAHAGANVVAIAIAICGPFDYENGISLMQRDKYASLYNLNLKQELAQRLAASDHLPIHFFHDVAAYLTGEIQDPCYDSFRRIICITLGTGVGTSFMVDRSVVTTGSGVIGHSIGRLPYQTALLEDRIGRNGLLTRFRDISPDSPGDWDVKDVCHAAKADHNRTCRQVFEELGAILGNTLAPIALQFSPDCLIVGGQISGAYEFFEHALCAELQGVQSLRMITRARSVVTGPLRGVAKLAWKRLQ